MRRHVDSDTGLDVRPGRNWPIKGDPPEILAYLWFHDHCVDLNDQRLADRATPIVNLDD